MNFPHGTNSTHVGKKRPPKWMLGLLGWILAALLAALVIASLLAITGFSRVRCEGASGAYHRHFWGRCL